MWNFMHKTTWCSSVLAKIICNSQVTRLLVLVKTNKFCFIDSLKSNFTGAAMHRHSRQPQRAVRTHACTHTQIYTPCGNVSDLYSGGNHWTLWLNGPDSLYMIFFSPRRQIHATTASFCSFTIHYLQPFYISMLCNVCSRESVVT